MEVRNNVRQRRRERIRQLMGTLPEGREGPERMMPEHSLEDRIVPTGQSPVFASEEDLWERAPSPEGPKNDPVRADRRISEPETVVPGTGMSSAASSAASDYGVFDSPYQEPDPERWWKERQRQERSYPPGRTPASPPRAKDGINSSVSSSMPGHSRFTSVGRPSWNDMPPGGENGSAMSRFVKGFMARLVLAAAVFGALWAWTNWKLPGSDELEGWTIRTVTEDMNFAAVEAWYERTFGGTPSFLPIFQNGDDTQAVSANWSREQTASPLAGRVVQAFSQSGTGIRLAAPAGTPVMAVHTGRVTQVTLNDQGLATIKVQHTNGVVTVYGNVAKPAVKVNDWVEAGRPLGEVQSASGGNGGEGMLEFAVQQNGKPIDPAEVVPFD